jgi:hypothetical protein
VAPANAVAPRRTRAAAAGTCLAILHPTPEGRVAFTPDGRYKFGGDIAGAFWHVIGLCRFEPGEFEEAVTRSGRTVTLLRA